MWVIFKIVIQKWILKNLQNIHVDLDLKHVMMYKVQSPTGITPNSHEITLSVHAMKKEELNK